MMMMPTTTMCPQILGEYWTTLSYYVFPLIYFITLVFIRVCRTKDPTKWRNTAYSESTCNAGFQEGHWSDPTAFLATPYPERRNRHWRWNTCPSCNTVNTSNCQVEHATWGILLTLRWIPVLNIHDSGLHPLYLDLGHRKGRPPW